MKGLRFIGLLLAAACLLTGCQGKSDLPGSVERGDIRLHLSSLEASIETRAGETPQEGYAFHNLLVVLTDDHGHVVDKVYKEYPYTPSAGDLQTAMGELPAEDVIYFQNLGVGTYHAYAYANIDHTAWQVTGETIAEVEKNLHSLKHEGETVSLNTGRELKAITSATAPVMPETSPMLLTGEVTVPLTVQVNEVDLPLLRPVLRLNVYVNNHTPYDLDVVDLRFSPFNATKTYLLDHRTAAGVPVVPAGTEYVDLPPLTGPVLVPKPAVEDDNDRTLVYSTLLYENDADAYKIFMEMDMQDPLAVHSNRTLGNTVYNVSLLSPADIPTEPGQSKTVMLVNPQYNGSGVVIGWDGTDFLYRKSPSIKEVNDYFTWLNYIVHSTDMTPYFFRLERLEADGPYGLFAEDGHNIFDNLDYLTKDQKNHCANGATGLNIKKVSEVDPNRKWNQIANDFCPYLLRFWCRTAQTESYEAYLWNHNQTALRTYADATNQARQWVLYEVSSEQEGLPISYLEKGTNKTKPLTHMSRNQDFNLDINVYYVEFETQFEFRVENTWWTDAGGHTSTHTFE